MTSILKANPILVWLVVVALAGAAVLSQAQQTKDPSGRPESNRDADARRSVPLMR